MNRLLSALLIVVLVAALTPTAVSASPLRQGEDEGAAAAIGRVIATLGLYAAMMAVLAVGAELLIDAVRPIFGLKRKTTASEALRDLKEWLPGTLADLDVSPRAQQQLSEQIEDLERLTTQFEGRAERVREAVRDELSDTLKDLAVHTAQETLEKHWGRLEPRLKEIDPDLDTAELKAWLGATLVRLKETNVAELAIHLESVSKLLDAVREQNNTLQGPLRKFWRWLRDSLLELSRAAERSEHLARWLQRVIVFLCRVPAYLEYAWAWLRRRLPEGDTLVERLENLGKHKRFRPLLTLDEAARRILEEDTRWNSQEKTRITWLRILSGVVGIALAASLQVDSLQLLEPVLGNAADTFRCQVGQTVKWCTFEMFIEQSGGGDINPTRGLPGALGATAAALLGLTPGLILSGLGAAAGSGFWHDQLDKLRSAKRVVTEVEDLAERIGG